MTSIPMMSRLPGLPLFDGLDGAALERIAAGMSEVSARSGTLIFRRGDGCRGLYIVITGHVKLALQAAQGSEKIVELVGPGGTFGETAVFLDRPYLYTASTLADTRLAQVSKATVLAELERTPRFTRAIIGSLCHRLQYLMGALEDCMLRSGTERVMGYLLNRVSPNAVNGNAVVTLPTKKGIIASQLNLTHEHFSRILRELFTAGLIEVDGRNVHIASVSQLRSRAGGA
jgi:CRP-like cAMP-binding protein